MARVCVIDDDAVTRDTIGHMLRFAGHETVIYDDAQAALDGEGRFDRIDVVLTDSGMPTPASVLLRSLIEARVRVPVIVMSGNFRDSDRTMYDRLGAVCLMEKPISIDELNDAIKTAME